MPIGIDLKPVSKYSKLPSAKECQGCRCYVLSEQTEYISIASAWVVNKGHGANSSTVIYVDSNRTDDYVATGSESSPFTRVLQMLFLRPLNVLFRMLSFDAFAGSGVTITSSKTLKTLAQYAEIELVFTSQVTAYVTGDRAAS